MQSIDLLSAIEWERPKRWFIPPRGTCTLFISSFKAIGESNLWGPVGILLSSFGNQTWQLKIHHLWMIFPARNLHFLRVYLMSVGLNSSRICFSAIPLAPPHLAVAVSGCSQDIIRDAHGAVSGHLKAAARRNNLSRTCVENARIIRESQLVTPINVIQFIYTYIHYYSFTFHSLDCDYLRYQTYVHAWTSECYST